MKKVSEAKLPTKFAEFKILVYEERGKEHVVLILGSFAANESVVVRVHSRCLTGDVFRSLRCDCYEQLVKSLEEISRQGKGVLIYLDQEGRGIGLVNKLQAYALQDKGLDTVVANEQLGFPADLRDYQTAAAILNDLGIKRLRLLTNNPAKIESLEKNGLGVERLPLEIESNEDNRRYLQTKKQKLNHLLCLPE